MKKVGNGVGARGIKTGEGFPARPHYTSVLSKPHRMQLALRKAAVYQSPVTMFVSPLYDNACAKR